MVKKPTEKACRIIMSFEPHDDDDEHLEIKKYLVITGLVLFIFIVTPNICGSASGKDGKEKDD